MSSCRVVGVFVTPHPEHIDVLGELDLRPPGTATLRLQILLGRVRGLRSVAFGDRVPADVRILQCSDGMEVDNSALTAPFNPSACAARW